jgi:hypothetical protein
MRALVIAAALLLGCGHTGYRAPLTCMKRGGPQWIELTSEHFILRTDNWPSVARAAIADFEIAYDAFFKYAGLVIPRREPYAHKIEIYAFERSEDYEAVSGHRVGGSFRDDGHEPGRVARIIMQGGLTLYARTLFQHEMTHSLVRQSLPGAPIWLNEGLADYLETMMVDGDRVIIGRSDRSFANRWVNVAREEAVAVERLPKLKDMLAASQKTFYAEENRTYFYAGAWALVHYLRHGEHAPRFARYLQQLATGTPADRAWNEAFAGVDLEIVDRELREQAAAKTIDFFVAPYKPGAKPQAEVRRMSDSEVHLLYLSLRPWRRNINNLAVGRELADAEAHGPPSPELTYWKGIFTAWQDGPRAAEALLRSAVQADPSSRKALYALVHVLHLIEKTKPSAEQKLDALKPLLKRLWKHSGDAEIANFVAWVYAEMKQPDLGMPFARLALAKEPGSPAYLDTQAKLLADTGFVDEALELQRRALAGITDGRPPQEMVDRLNGYEKAVAAQRVR